MSIHIIVKSVTGLVIDLDINQNITIENIKAMIQDKVNIPFYEQRLIHSGKELEDNKTAEASKIKNQDILILVLRK
jgi:ubiquitin-like protein Nedd8